MISIPRRSWRGNDLINLLADLIIMHRRPEYIRSKNGPEFIAKRIRQWFSNTGIQTLYIEPGSPWENGYCESLNARMRDEFLNGELFDTLMEAEIMSKQWRKYYNTIRPQSTLGYRPPAPQAYLLTA